ncbi:hypothetical protein Bca52824_079761 [Brassica carinata]|uniref:Uncharacterized protein n=1 Tax=Brassica carinata TaxID=52824 RepID=A0A8X7PZW5_BRACI|nr:hypothetical protein Bca52824_079761 [Brassica carinata]
MEVSSFSTVPSFCYSSSVPESCRFRGVKVRLWDQSLVPVRLSIPRRTPRDLVGFRFMLDSLWFRLNLVIDRFCMDEIYDKLAERLVPTSAAMFSPNVKRLVGLAGPPGAGKSTLAYEVVTASFDAEVMPPDVATVLPMDGFHLYRSQLDAMEDPKEAHARRGAPWTFNPALLLNCLKKLRNEVKELVTLIILRVATLTLDTDKYSNCQGSVYVPSFDHGVGDPVEDDIFVSLQRTWKDISDMFDEKWFIDVNLDTAMQRVEARHISTGKPPDVAKWRVDYSGGDELIVKSKTNADVLIRSVSFESAFLATALN